MWIGKWDGGRVRTGRNGDSVWVLERMIEGRRYVKALDARSEKEALAELALFNSAPDQYATKVERAAQAKAVFINDYLLRRLDARMEKEEQSQGHRKSIDTYLRAWAKVLKPKDFRRITLAHLKTALATWDTAERYRVIAIRTFTAFLREEGLLTLAQDASQDLPVPPAKPGKPHEARAYTVAHVEKVYRHLSTQCVRDFVHIAAKTGLHGTEIARLAAGKGEVKELPGYGEIAGTIRLMHKKGTVHVQSVDRLTLEAAKRLQARKRAPVGGTLHAAIWLAAKGAGVETINPGQLRHSFITWALESGRKVEPKAGGVAINEVAGIVGHKSSATTKKYYEGVQVPMMVVVPISLHHPEDPTPLVQPVVAVA